MTKKLIVILILIALMIPILNINYYNGASTEVRKISVIGLLIQDVIDGTVGTKL